MYMYSGIVRFKMLPKQGYWPTCTCISESKVYTCSTSTCTCIYVYTCTCTCVHVFLKCIHLHNIQHMTCTNTRVCVWRIQREKRTTVGSHRDGYPNLPKGPQMLLQLSSHNTHTHTHTVKECIHVHCTCVLVPVHMYMYMYM